ncbi:MAG: AbrB/MazE/SpoVT family DNA-binding domain-containing protein [Candidatus Thiodiazotropha sp.]
MVREAKIINIGNSKGLRLPKNIIAKYHFKDEVVIEEKREGILIHAKENQKISWDETYQAIAKDEDWSDWHEVFQDDE